MPLLRRSYDHYRELRARRCTPRPAVTPSRGQNRDAMTPVTTLSHCPPAGEPRFRRRTTVASAPPKARATPAIMPKSPRRPLPRRQTRHRDRRSAANHTGQRIPYPTSRPVKSPSTADRTPAPRGFLPGGLSDAGTQYGWIGHDRPASETLHPIGPSAHPDRRNRLPGRKLAILAPQQERYHRAAVIPDHVTDELPPIVSARTKRNLPLYPRQFVASGRV